jgi:hypothetical protein
MVPITRSAEDLDEKREVLGHAFHEGRGNDERDQQPEAVDHALNGSGGEAQREAQVVPVGQEITADQLADAQRQHFISEEADVNRLDGTPETEPRDGRQQRAPAPAVHDIDDQIAHHRDADPFPI